MIISILFLLVILMITLDSIGSKRLRGQVIKQSKAFFDASEIIKAKRSTYDPSLEELTNFLNYSRRYEATPVQTLRLKLKGAQKKEQAKQWQPIEAKQFQTLQPLSLTYYEDRTLGFLLSTKKYRRIKDNQSGFQQWVFSLFPYAHKQIQENKWLNWMHLLASLPWAPDLAFLKGLHWKKDPITKIIVATLHIDGKRLRAYYNFQHNGQVTSFHCTLDEIFGPTSEIKLSYQYFDFEQVEDWKVPMRVKYKETILNSTTESEFKITQLVYNEDFAWW